jgi:hypothetical protein
LPGETRVHVLILLRIPTFCSSQKPEQRSKGEELNPEAKKGPKKRLENIDFFYGWNRMKPNCLAAKAFAGQQGREKHKGATWVKS